MIKGQAHQKQKARLRAPAEVSAPPTYSVQTQPLNQPLLRLLKEKDRTTDPGGKPTRVHQWGNSLPGEEQDLLCHAGGKGAGTCAKPAAGWNTCLAN